MNYIMSDTVREQLSLLTSEMYDKRDLLIKPYSYFKKFDKDTIRLFLHFEAIYCLPTQELIDFLKSEIEDHTAIEIGCGNGSIARALKIPATDSRMQERPEIQLLYKMSGQPLIKYPSFVERLEARQAVKKYSPDIVIGSYITHRWNGKSGNADGPDEPAIFKQVKKLIHIGDLNTHREKPLMKLPYKKYTPDWLIVRGQKGFIGIWKS